MDKFKEVYSLDWLAANKLELEKLLEEKAESLQNLNNKMHELELDLALNEEDYWIANYEQKKLFQMISAMGIKVYYGSDFLINLSDEQEKLLQDYPLLPYGLVLRYEADWKKIENNLPDKDIFRAPVPIFINYQLEENVTEYSFKLIHGQEEKFITAPETYSKWYNGLNSLQQEIADTVLILRNKIKNIDKAVFTAEKLLQEKSSTEVAKEMAEIAEKINSLKKDLGNISKKLEYLMEGKAKLEKGMAEREDIIERLKEDYQEMKDFAEETALLEKQRTEIEKIKEYLAELEESLARNYTDQQQNRKTSLNIVNVYQKWLEEILIFLAELRKIIPKIEFKEQETAEQFTNYPLLYDYRDSQVYCHYQRLLDLEIVRLRRSDLLPENEEGIITELKSYFVEIIAKFNKEGIKVDRLTDSRLKKYMGDAALFSRAVRGRYPILQVYKMTEKNEFHYAKPKDYFYADWESVIQGKGDTPEGSGGQSLSINAFMMMMLLNYKKQRLDQTNPWTVLLLDNPFGKASAAHVLDPIFEIADKLNFQIIAFAAPEIIKTEISERFPVFWALEISDDDKERGVINGQVIYGGRKRRMEATI